MVGGELIPETMLGWSQCGVGLMAMVWCGYARPATGAGRFPPAPRVPMASDHHPLDRLDVSSRVLKRAQYEALAFFLRPPYVEVRNYSYPDPENHSYRIGIADGIPINCTCPADVEYARACKHRVGLAIRSRILDMAIEAKVAAGGGATNEI